MIAHTEPARSLSRVLTLAALCAILGSGASGCAASSGAALDETASSASVRTLAGPGPVTKQYPAIRPSLSGTWVLNEKLSDDPREKLRQAREQARSDTGDETGRAGGGFGGRHHRRDTGEQGGFERGGGARSGPEGLAGIGRPPGTLVLKQEGEMLTVSTPGGQTQRIYTDNRGASVSASGGMQQKVVTAGWEGDALVVETTLPTEERIIERYRLLSSPRELRVDATYELPNTGKAISLKRIYDPAGVEPQRRAAGSGTLP